MRPAATRSRLLDLTRQAAAARRGRQLLEEKREALIRAVSQARQSRQEARARAIAALGRARGLLVEAEIELGAEAVEAAGLAQTRRGRIALVPRSLLGVPQPVIQSAFEPLRIRYAPGSGSESLDRATACFGDALEAAIALAQKDLALHNLRAGLARTSRRANALDQIILPGLQREIRHVESALEEEARDEAVRTRRRGRGGSPQTGVSAGGAALAASRLIRE